MTPRQRLTAALRRQPTDWPPVWLMRQAGRYLPGYREVRARHGFWEVCQTPTLSTQVALEPLDRYALDAAIVFSDILIVLEALGLDVSFVKGEGPHIGRPLRSAADLAAWRREGLAERLAFQPAAVAHLRSAIGPDRGLLGFCGAPWTLLGYAVDGGSGEELKLARTMLRTEPALAREALDLLADTGADLLAAQLDAGADAVQIFDTWGGLLDRDTYAAFAVPALRRMIAPLRARGADVILFVRGGHHLLPLLPDTGASAFSLDWRTPMREGAALLPGATLQGNLDPTLLFAGEAVVRAATRGLLDEMQRLGPGFIVNLGHGILPGTPPEAVGALVQTVVESGRHGA